MTNLNNLNNWIDQFVPDKNSLWKMSATAQTSTQGYCRRVGHIRRDSTNEGKGTCPSPMTQRTRAVAKGSWVARVQIDGSTENARWWRCCDRVFVCVRVQLLFPLRDRQVAVVARGVGWVLIVMLKSREETARKCQRVPQGVNPQPSRNVMRREGSTHLPLLRLVQSIPHHFQALFPFLYREFDCVLDALVGVKARVAEANIPTERLGILRKAQRGKVHSRVACAASLPPCLLGVLGTC